MGDEVKIQIALRTARAAGVIRRHKTGPDESAVGTQHIRHHQGGQDMGAKNYLKLIFVKKMVFADI